MMEEDLKMPEEPREDCNTGTSEVKSEKIDLRKMVIYSEIMKPKFED